MTAICRVCTAEFPADPGTHPTCPACGAKNPFPTFKPRRKRSFRVPLPASVRGRLLVAFAGFGTVAVLVAIVVLSRQFR